MTNEQERLLASLENKQRLVASASRCALSASSTGTVEAMRLRTDLDLVDLLVELLAREDRAGVLRVAQCWAALGREEASSTKRRAAAR